MATQLLKDAKGILGGTAGVKPGQTLAGLAAANKITTPTQTATQSRPSYYYDANTSAQEIARNFAGGQPTSSSYFQSLQQPQQNVFTQTLNQQGYQNPFTVNAPAITPNTTLNEASNPAVQGSLNNLISQFRQGFGQDDNFLNSLSPLYSNLAQLGADLGDGTDVQSPDIAGQYNTLQQQYGVQGMNDALTGLNQQQTQAQGQLDNIRSQAQQLQNQYMGYIQSIEGQGGFENIVGGRQARLSKDLERKLIPLQQAEQNAINNLNRINTQVQNQQENIKSTKNDILEQIKLGQQNFENLQSIQATKYGRKKDQYGIMKDLVDNVQKALDKQTENARNGRLDELALIKTLTDIPEGMSIRLSDGSVYTGLKSSTSDIKQYSETDENGDVTVVGLNQDGSLAFKTSLGNIGKPQAGDSISGPDLLKITNDIMSQNPAWTYEQSLSEAYRRLATIGGGGGGGDGTQPTPTTNFGNEPTGTTPQITRPTQVQTQDFRNRVLQLPAGQQESAFAVPQALLGAQKILDLLDKGVKTGPITGRLFGGLQIFGKTVIPGSKQIKGGNPEQNQFDASATTFTANFIKAISGAQVSDKEREFLMKALPSVNNQEAVNRDNLTVLVDWLKNKYQTQLGINFDDYPDILPTPISSVQLQDLAEKKGYNKAGVLQLIQQGRTPQQIKNFLEGKNSGASGNANQTPMNQINPISSVQIPKSSRLAYVNNNPGNLRFAGQSGAQQGEGGFARFNTPEEGYRALQNQIRLDAGRGHTLSSFINKYAPPSENNTSQYLAQISGKLGVKPTTKISAIDVNRLSRLIAQKESSTNIG